MTEENTEPNNKYSNVRKGQLSRWLIFINERFDPISHFIMIALFVYAHYLVADASKFVIIEPHLIAYVAIGTSLFFLKLRLYDEIKDYEVDLEKNPTRPLPRGLLKHFDVKRAIEFCLILEIIFFTSCGAPAFISILFAIGYSLLMYKEFFIPKLIRPHLTTYATSHTVVTFFLSVAIFSSFSRFNPWSMDKDFYLFSLLSWLSFNIFELGRKVYQPCEEREGVPTYSSIWGKFGAFMLVFLHAIAVSALILYISTVQYFFMLKLLIVQLILLFIIGIIYLLGKTQTTGNLFRIYSSLYIVLVYTSIIINYFIRGLK
jgi:4-hydroxybenzoate polyprenyltransferase